jgi:hypothetical protein
MLLQSRARPLFLMLQQRRRRCIGCGAPPQILSRRRLSCVQKSIKHAVSPGLCLVGHTLSFDEKALARINFRAHIGFSDGDATKNIKEIINAQLIQTLVLQLNDINQSYSLMYAILTTDTMNAINLIAFVIKMLITTLFIELPNNFEWNSKEL